MKNHPVLFHYVFREKKEQKSCSLCGAPNLRCALWLVVLLCLPLLFVRMITEVTKRPKLSVGLPPRKINVQKYAESRAVELKSLQSIIEKRVKGDYRCQRNKRRRTTSFNDLERRRKRQKLQMIDDKTDPAELGLEKDLTKKLPCRRVRRRYELKMNPESGFCASSDGNKRLRTHVWHAKRFTMTKLWGYYLPLALQGRTVSFSRGKGSRALLNRFKQGVLVHDASYCTAVQLEGPEDSLASVLRMVLTPFPATHCKDYDESVSGITCRTAMLYQVGAPVSQAVAPVNYMWRPAYRKNVCVELDSRKQFNSFKEHDKTDESIKSDVSLSENSDKMNHHGASFRQLWVWIHASAFEEGYDNLKLACQKEMEERGTSVNCFSLEGQLAKLELIGSGTFQLLQKILRPIRGTSENHVATQDYFSENKSSSILENEDNISSLLSLNVKDPRELSEERTTCPMEPISADAVIVPETSYNSEEGVLKKNIDLSSPPWSEHEDSLYDNNDDLWYATSRGLRPPVKESTIAMEKHCKRMAHFMLDDAESEEVNHSTRLQCSRSCPIVLIKNDKELLRGWSVVLPLSWVKAFWIPLISNGAHAIGLQEKHWVADELGLPFFPLGFPDCSAYSCFMADKTAGFNRKVELRPPSKRPFRVPILPPWGVIQNTYNKKINAVEAPDVSTQKCLAGANSMLDSCPGNFKVCDSSTFDGTVLRTGSMLSTFLSETKAVQLLLFPFAADGNARISKFMKDEVHLNPSDRTISNHSFCFLRVHLQPFREGLFEEGAVICAPHPSDISLWTSGSEDHSSNRWVMHLPDDPIANEYHRWPIGFVTSGSIPGSKRLVPEGFCEAVLLSHLREEQWKEMKASQRRKEIYVLVRNLRSVAYRLALLSVVLEYQENDIDFL